jgi:SAM-dependent methyltransferase
LLAAACPAFALGKLAAALRAGSQVRNSLLTHAEPAPNIVANSHGAIVRGDRDAYGHVAWNGHSPDASRIPQAGVRENVTHRRAAERRPWHAFSDVDGSGRVGELKDMLAIQADAFTHTRRRRLASLRIGRGDAVLDAGCGLGEMTRELARHVGVGGRAVGIDASAEMVSEARDGAARDGSAADHRLGRLEALDLPDRSFDAVYCERVLMHLADPDRALRELLRVLRPGGRLVVVDGDLEMGGFDATDADAAAELYARANAAVARNPRSGRQLGARLRRAGAVPVTVEAEAIVTTRPMLGRGWFFEFHAPLVDDLVRDGVLAKERGAALLADLAERIVEGSFFEAATLVTATATRPGN